MNLFNISRFGVKPDESLLSKGFRQIGPHYLPIRVRDVAFNRFQSIRIEGAAVLVAYFKAIISRWVVRGGDIDRTHRTLINHRVGNNRGWSRPLCQVNPQAIASQDFRAGRGKTL